MEQLKELPKYWAVKLYPEVKQWIKEVKDYSVFSGASPNSYWWSSRDLTFSFVDDGDIELTREQFNLLLLGKTPEEIDYHAIDYSQSHKAYKENDNTRFVEYTTRDPYGYNFLKSRR